MVYLESVGPFLNFLSKRKLKLAVQKEKHERAIPFRVRRFLGCLDSRVLAF